MSLIDIVIILLIVGFGLFLLGKAPIDPTIKQIIYAFVILIIIIWLLKLLFPGINEIYIGKH